MAWGGRASRGPGLGVVARWLDQGHASEEDEDFSAVRLPVSVCFWHWRCRNLGGCIRLIQTFFVDSVPYSVSVLLVFGTQNRKVTVIC